MELPDMKGMIGMYKRKAAAALIAAVCLLSGCAGNGGGRTQPDTPDVKNGTEDKTFQVYGRSAWLHLS